MAGQHVRQIFQQPYRRQLPHATVAPLVKIKLIAIPRDIHGGGQFIQFATDQPRADITAKPFGFE